EQIDLVAEQRAVIGAFLDHDVVKSVGIGVDRARAHAARRAFTAYDQALGPELAQVRDYRRAEEGGGALLVDHELAGRGRELLLDVIKRLRLGTDPAVR